MSEKVARSFAEQMLSALACAWKTKETEETSAWVFRGPKTRLDPNNRSVEKEVRDGWFSFFIMFMMFCVMFMSCTVIVM